MSWQTRLETNHFADSVSEHERGLARRSGGEHGSAGLRQQRAQSFGQRHRLLAGSPPEGGAASACNRRACRCVDRRRCRSCGADIADDLRTRNGPVRAEVKVRRRTMIGHGRPVAAGDEAWNNIDPGDARRGIDGVLRDPWRPCRPPKRIAYGLVDAAGSGRSKRNSSGWVLGVRGRRGRGAGGTGIGCGGSPVSRLDAELARPAHQCLERLDLGRQTNVGLRAASSRAGRSRGRDHRGGGGATANCRQQCAHRSLAQPARGPEHPNALLGSQLVEEARRRDSAKRCALAVQPARRRSAGAQVSQQQRPDCRGRPHRPIWLGGTTGPETRRHSTLQIASNDSTRTRRPRYQRARGLWMRRRPARHDAVGVETVAVIDQDARRTRASSA